MALTAKQELFCKEYIVDLNATQAAIRAGYSERTAGSVGHENLKKPEIADKIAELQQERGKKVGIDAQWVLDRLVELTDRCMQGEPVTDREGNPTGEWKFDSSGANKALENIGKHLGMFKEKVEHSGNMGVSIINDIPRKQ
ncbi:terminase small subunit [Paenibacillus sabinae]|uniref:Terminase small subunit n=1 Tax=Paenibacillus sabinae T27 TaxID=1268072 RepID=X4Z8W0_9BACL|nr:terminase small subunit [Paenibacillus sabinae]AHV96146.1 terminase small subunit [Paenibacillus sabinae T27]